VPSSKGVILEMAWRQLQSVDAMLKEANDINANVIRTHQVRTALEGLERIVMDNRWKAERNG
jgi:hypothetical protein